LEDNKKPGPRDISDLKARLGLKKTGTMPAVTQSTPQPPGQQQAPNPLGQPAQPQYEAAPPPAASAASRPLPNPFGRPEPAPQAPPPAAPPDPRRDPFAQQQQASLAAFYGINQSIPGSADALDAQPISKPKPWGKIGFILGVSAVPFIIGSWVGAISRGRSDYNTTTEQAGQIYGEVEKISKQLTAIADTINASPESRKGNVDIEMSAKLGALDLKKPDTVKIFHTNYQNLEPIVVERLMQYYNGTTKLLDEVAAHSKKTENDKDALVRMQKEGAKADKNYGVIVEQQGGLTLAKFVEVGSPVCNDPSKTDCNANELKGFQYRLDSGSGWGTRPVKGKPESIVMPLQQTPLFKAVAAGNPDFLAVKDYARRMAEIRQQLGQLMNSQKEVLGDLKKASDRPKMLAL
jgi:hypothetical protein